jgi:hypothetical protein
MCKINKNGTWDKGEQKVMTKNKNLFFYQYTKGTNQLQHPEK